jgi:serine/threonine-protein kinase
VRFQIAPSPGTTFDRRAPALALSRDGRTMAWSACERAATSCELYVRNLDRVEAVRLKGTEGARAPFFSPDGRWLGFFADGRLKKIAVAGGSAVTLADAPSPAGGSWGSDGRIVFAGSPAGGLSVTSDQGGGVEVLTKPRADRGEVRHTWPAWMGDGRSVLFTVATSPLPDAPGQLALLPSETESWRSLRAGVARGAASGFGFLLYSTGNDLQAQAFDERASALTGATDTVADSVATADGVPQFAVAGGNALASVAASPSPRRLTWSDDPSRTLTALDNLTAITISPDGRRAAGVSTDAAGSEIWIVDLDRNTSRRVTFGGTNVLPAWTSDGRGLLFATRSTGPFAISSFSEATGARVEPTLAADGHLFPGSASAREVAVTRHLADGRLAIGIAPRSGGTVKLLEQGPFDRTSPAFSPDGEWLAFASDESGRWEIYVQRVPDGRPAAVSNGGGTRPVWSADGRSIYYCDASRVMRAAFDRERETHTGAPEVLFERADTAIAAVSPTGRILIESQPAAPEAALVVLQWLRETRLRLPAPVTAPR